MSGACEESTIKLTNELTFPVGTLEQHTYCRHMCAYRAGGKKKCGKKYGNRPASLYYPPEFGCFAFPVVLTVSVRSPEASRASVCV